MKKRTGRGLTAVALCALLALSGCATQVSGAEASSEDTTVTAISSIDTATVFSDRDLAGTYEESEAIAIALNGNSITCTSDAVAIDGSQVTIGEEGTYLISGTLTDGQIVVNADQTDKVQLVLNGANITSTTSAAIYALEADKVFITLSEGTENTLTNGGEYVAIGENNIDAVIFAKTDLTLNGSGSLTINAQAGHGVVSKDDLVIAGAATPSPLPAMACPARTASPLPPAHFPSPPARTVFTLRTATISRWATSTSLMEAFPSPPRGMPPAPRGHFRLMEGPSTFTPEKEAPAWR